MEPEIGDTFSLVTRVRPRTETSGVPATEPTDAALLRRCRDGDAAGWDLLVHRYERLVFSVAVRNGLARPDAADVTQATFLALLESLGDIQDEQRLASWLMTVARRQAWRLRARWGREAPVGLADPPSEPTVDDFTAWEREAALHEALDRLGSPCSDLLRSLYLDPCEPSYATLAARLGRQVGSIGPMRGRCLERLRTLLGEAGT